MKHEPNDPRQKVESTIMKKIEQELLDHCPGCARRIFAGAIFGVLAEIEETPKLKVYGLNTDSLAGCMAIYLGCLISQDMTCPACGSLIQKTIEVEYSEKCESCDNPPNGRTWYWDASRRCNVGFCDECSRLRDLREDGA